MMGPILPPVCVLLSVFGLWLFFFEGLRREPSADAVKRLCAVVVAGVIFVAAADWAGLFEPLNGGAQLWFRN